MTIAPSCGNPLFTSKPQMKQALARQPLDPQWAEHSFRQGLASHKAGDLRVAEAHYRATLRVNPRHAAALHHLGLIAHQAGRHAAAAGLIARSLAAEPDSAAAANDLGLVRIALDQPHDARLSLERSVRLAPEWSNAHYNLGIAADRGGDLDAAIAAYREATRLQPDFADALCNLAIDLHAAGARHEAVAAYRRALVCDPSLSRLWVYLALAQTELGHFTAARQAAERGVALLPADAIYFGGDLEGSLAPLRQSLRCLADHYGAASPWAPEPGFDYPVASYSGALAATLACAEAAGLDLFLTCGTILGAIRDNGFMRHDKDIDLGIWADVALGRLRAAMAADPDFSDACETGPHHSQMSWTWRGTVAVDVFRYERGDEHASCDMWIGSHPISWLHHPFALRRHTFSGLACLVPDDPDRYLTELYGDWRTPNPYFGIFASPNIKGGFPPICRSLAYTSLFRAVALRQRDRAINLCGQVLALDPGDALVADLRARIAGSPAAMATAARRHDAESTLRARFAARAGGDTDPPSPLT